MSDLDFYGYKEAEDGKYTVLKNGEVFIRGLANAREAAKLVETLLRDERRAPDIRSLGEEELLCQLAEEASELAQAALKLRRAITRRNPTPKTEQECREALCEEVADVDMLFKELLLTDGANINKILKIEKAKKARWEDRLRNRC